MMKSEVRLGVVGRVRPAGWRQRVSPSYMFLNPRLFAIISFGDIDQGRGRTARSRMRGCRGLEV